MFIKLFLFYLLLAALSCQSGETGQSKTIPDPVALTVPEVFIDFEEGGLTAPASLALMPEGRLAVLDYKKKKVLVYDPKGTQLNSFGRDGRGPGEFARPLSLQKSFNYLNVVDYELYRINQFSYEGTFVQSYTVEENTGVSSMTVKEGKQYYAGARGRNGHLLKLVNVESDSVNFFGTAMTEEEPVANMEEARQTLARGELPEMFKNDIKISYNGEHLYVFLNGYSRLQKYAPEGDLLWERSIELPVNELYFQHQVDRAKESRYASVPIINYITAMKVIDGEIFLLWTPVDGHPRKLVRVSPEGTVTALYDLPEEEPTFYDFTVDPDRNRLYLAAPELGQIYEVLLPDFD